MRQTRQLTTKARFTCPACNNLVTVDVDVPEVDWTVEPLSDSLSEDDAEIECPACGSGFSVYVQNSPSHCKVEMYDHPSVQIEADDAPFSAGGPDEEEDWLNSSIPADPHKIFHDTCYHLEDVLAEYGEDGRGVLQHSAALINRMTFAQSVSVLEAYLGDTLVNAVMSRPESMRRLVAKDIELSEQKLTLVQILDNHEIVSERVEDYLRGLLYHNLAKVEVIYKIALGVEIIPDKELKARLFKAMSIRHDLVHRNGKDKNGVVVQLPSYVVSGAISDIRAFVNHVEKIVQAVGKTA